MRSPKMFEVSAKQEAAEVVDIAGRVEAEGPQARHESAWHSARKDDGI